MWFKYEYGNRRKDSLPEWAFNYYKKSSEVKFSFDDLCEKINEAIISGFDGKFPEFKKAITSCLKEKSRESISSTLTKKNLIKCGYLCTATYYQKTNGTNKK